jgi:hypothetical protein
MQLGRWKVKYAESLTPFEILYTKVKQLPPKWPPLLLERSTTQLKFNSKAFADVPPRQYPDSPLNETYNPTLLT